MSLSSQNKLITISLNLLICVIVLPCFGDFSALQFEVYNKKNSGLPIDEVRSVTEDKDGFMWVATEYGLRRFNGVEFETLFDITGKDFGSKFDLQIKELFFDSNDNLWIATLFNGIYKLNLSTFTLQAYNESYTNEYALTSGIVLSLLEDDKHNIWVITSKGLNKYNLLTEKMMIYSNNELFSENIEIQSLEYSPQDKFIWIGTFNGIYYFNTENNMAIKIDNTPHDFLQTKQVTSIHYDGMEKLWISAHNKLYYYDYERKDFTEFDLEDRLEGEIIYSINSDNFGVIWLGTDSGSLIAINPVKHNFLWSYQLSDSSKGNNAILQVYISSNGQLWLSTYLTGLWKANLSNRIFGVFTSNIIGSDNHINQNNIRSIYEDQYENPWISTYGFGINHYDFKQKKWLFYPTSYFTNQIELYKELVISDIVSDFNNNIFLSTWNKIIKFNPEKRIINEFIDNHNKIDNKKYYEDMSWVCYDSKNRLWIYAFPSYISYINVNSGERKFFAPLNNKDVNDIFESENKRIWIITSKGLLLYNENEQIFDIVTIKLDKTIDPGIHSIYESPTGILWLGTNYGLIKYNVQDKTTKLYTNKNGLSNNVVAGMLADDQENLWLATFNGLNKFNYKSETFITYYTEDGLPDNEFDTGRAYKAKSGRMYFAGPSGVVYFEPDDIKINSKTPKIALTDFKISNEKIFIGSNNNPLPLGKQISDVNNIELNYKQNDFSLKFTALDYHSPERIQYKYKLNGYKDNWIETDYKNRIIQYANLEAGNYTLHIKAGNHHNIWNEEGKKLHITILPPPWKTWWAYTAYILFTLLTLWALYTYRTKQLHQRALILQQEVDKQTEELKQQKSQLEEQNEDINQLIQAKDQIFANISHELKTPLTLITGPLKAITKKARERQEANELNMIQRNAYRLLRMVDQLLELSKLQQAKQSTEDEQSLTAYVPLHDIIKTTAPFKHTAAAKGINFEIKQNDEALIYCQQDYLEKIILNLTNNAIKYTLDGSIEISSQWHDDNHIVIKVKDTGMGIPEDKMDTLFDRFTRVHNVENQRKSIAGAGIGLSLVKELVEKLSGRIDVKSKMGEGSEFAVYLPAVKKDTPGIEYNPIYLESVENITIEIGGLSEEMHHELDSEDQTNDVNQIPAETGKEYTLLIIDDNADIRNYVSGIFKSIYNIHTAHDGVDGIKIAENEIPDLIISDVMMPEQDGFHVCQHLKEKEMTCHIPIILLTALHDQDSRLRGLKQHADAYMTKPFDPEELKIQVENLLSLREMMKHNSAYHLIPDPASQKVPANPGQNPKDIQFLEKFKKILDDKYTDVQLNMLYIASRMAISDRQLQRKIKAVTGKKPVEYLRRYRIEKSLELIKQGRSMEQVSYETGFSTRNYFTNCFRAVMGESPTQYQKRYISEKAVYQ